MPVIRSTTSARHRAPRRLRPASFLAPAAAIAAATLVGAALSGGTFALWNGESAIESRVVTSGSLAITASEAFDVTQWNNLLVGETARQPFTIHNSGNVPATLKGSVVTGTTALEVRLASGACTTALTGASATVTPKVLPTIAPGATSTVCLEVKLAAGAVQGQVVAFTTTITAGQVH